MTFIRICLIGLLLSSVVIFSFCKEIQVIQVTDDIDPTQPLSGRPIDLISITLKNRLLCSLEQLNKLEIGFYVHKPEALRFKIQELHSGYTAFVKKSGEYHGYYRMEGFSTSKLKINGVIPDLIRVLIKDSKLVHYPALVYCDKKIPRKLSELHFWFQRNGELSTQRFMIVNHQNQIIFKDEFHPPKKVFKFSWDGRDNSGILVKPNYYTIIIKNMAQKDTTTQQFEFYLPDYYQILKH